MSKITNASIDVGQRVNIPVYGSNPSASNGRIYFNTSTEKLRLREGNSWRETGAASTYSDLQSMNGDFAGLSYNSASDFNTVISGMGYTLVATPRYGSQVESMGSGDPTTTTGVFSLSAWESNSSLAKTTGFDGAEDDRYFMAMAVTDSNRYYGIWVMTFEDSRNLLKEFFFDEDDQKQIQVFVFDYQNNTETRNSSTTTWTFSNNQVQQGNGYYATNRLAADDGLWGFNINSSADGNWPGPDLTANEGYGFGNYNAGDSSRQYVRWGGTSYTSNTYHGYVFVMYE